MKFDKDMTQVVKGVAIIFMMLLHCFGVDGNYDVPVDTSHAPFIHFNSTFKLCVGIFTFMVGYGYAFSKTKDLRYSLQHIKKLLIPFWTILFVFTIPFCYREFWASGWPTMLKNLIGVDSTFNWYSWFVYFFIYAMAVLPFISRFVDRRPLRNAAIVIVAAYLIEVAVHAIPGALDEGSFHYALFNCLLMTPGMTVGYLFAHERYFERIEVKSQPKAAVVTLSLLLIVAVLAVRYFGHNVLGFNFDFVYAALTIGAIVVIFNTVEAKWIRKVLQALGKVSVYMWFFHALFFTKAVRWFYQPAITIFDDLNLIVLWAIALTFAASWLIKIAVDFVILKTTNSTN